MRKTFHLSPQERSRAKLPDKNHQRRGRGNAETMDKELDEEEVLFKVSAVGWEGDKDNDDNDNSDT